MIKNSKSDFYAVASSRLSARRQISWSTRTYSENEKSAFKAIYHCNFHGASGFEYSTGIKTHYQSALIKCLLYAKTIVRRIKIIY